MARVDLEKAAVMKLVLTVAAVTAVLASTATARAVKLITGAQIKMGRLVLSTSRLRPGDPQGLAGGCSNGWCARRAWPDRRAGFRGIARRCGS